MLRQKAFHFEKSYKGRVSKGAFKAKVATWGNMVLEKTLKSQSDSSSVVMKSHHPSINSVLSLTTSILPDKDTSILPDKDTSILPIKDTSILSIKNTRIVPIKDIDLALPALDSKSFSPSAPESKLSSNTKVDIYGPSSATDYHEAIP
ncbi:putative E3 ubiquitin-protein ligase [Abeliophyllum distichum]|uniref:E3 ubiquitin-protein ligase n=1 Tax=Abeliophyllum distichum TaxID=126358 RepID=A0ABD1SSZ3_9LAMI